MWLQCLQRRHGHKQLHGVVGQRQEEVERLVEGQCVVVEHIEDDAHGGQALRVARYLIGMPERMHQRFCSQALPMMEPLVDAELRQQNDGTG